MAANISFAFESKGPGNPYRTVMITAQLTIAIWGVTFLICLFIQSEYRRQRIASPCRRETVEALMGGPRPIWPRNPMSELAVNQWRSGAPPFIFEYGVYRSALSSSDMPAYDLIFGNIY